MTDLQSRVWFAGFVLLVFVSGLAGGILLDRLLVDRGFDRPPGILRAGRGFDPWPRIDRLGLRRFADELDLTSDQRRRLETIFEARRGRLRAFREEVNTRFEQEQQELRAEVAKILTPEQLQRYDELMRAGPGRGGRRGRGPM